MNVHTLFADAAASVDHTVAAHTVDADLGRARRALARRRTRRGGAVGLVAAGVLAGGLVLGGADPAPVTPSASGPGQDTMVVVPGGVQLVSYVGDQLPGYSVDRVPEGWQLLSADADALLIGPLGTTDRDPDSFLGKLAVMLMSADGAVPTEGVPVQVGTVPGIVTSATGGMPGEVDSTWGTDPRELVLYFVDPVSGQPVVVQVPAALDWTPAQAADFAAGVHVTDAAVDGVG